MTYWIGFEPYKWFIFKIFIGWIMIEKPFDMDDSCFLETNLNRDISYFTIGLSPSRTYQRIQRAKRKLMGIKDNRVKHKLSNERR